MEREIAFFNAQPQIHFSHDGAFALKASQVFTPTGILRNVYVHISQGRIDVINAVVKSGYVPVDFGDCKLMPGLIDMHIHGHSGADTMDATPKALSIISKGVAMSGVVGFMATTVTAPWEKILMALANVKHVMTSCQQEKSILGAEILGAYVEGPFFTSKNKGAHPEQFFLAPSDNYINDLLEVAGEALKVVALAPEKEGAVDATRLLTSKGIHVAMGHTNATWNQIDACITAGASIGTHLYNGMRGLHHREPGCVGAMLASDDVVAEIIADGIHVHPTVLKLSWKCKGTERLALITDCMCAGGLPDGVYQLGELAVTVKDGIVRTSSGSLAGSTLSLNRAVKSMVQQAGIPELDAVRMASEVPARTLGIDDRLGSIASGKEASLTVMDNDFNVLLTLVRGQQVFSALSETH
ncbi:MAG: N-acetylglucosamine-6-phosphate deacetylase [Endozoicomonas sp. (ex Botrylloides leachii)]|nr:N-acetylglucosamine-6-phosphate deacetylase [Endozoicomonas sp. (ex Botrylloides leachii)]